MYQTCVKYDTQSTTGKTNAYDKDLCHYNLINEMHCTTVHSGNQKGQGHSVSNIFTVDPRYSWEIGPKLGHGNRYIFFPATKLSSEILYIGRARKETPHDYIISKRNTYSHVPHQRRISVSG